MLDRHKTKILFFSIAVLLALTGKAQNKETVPFINYVPKGFELLETVKGDLNKDGFADFVLIVQAIDKKKFHLDKYRGKLNLNRKGLIILLKKGNLYEKVLENTECFASEDEYTGAYIPPEFEIKINKGNLSINYGQGANGFWNYTFRYTNSIFELIGYDTGYKSETEFECVVFDEESINLLTAKRQIKKVISVDKDCKETYKESWKEIRIIKKIKLQTVKDFEEITIDEIVKDK